MKKTDEHRRIWGILLGAFVLRTILMLLCKGYSTDVTCFTAWSENMVAYGAEGFYTAGFFADYPPGYLYYLWGAGLFNRLFGINPYSPGGLYVISFLPLLCDIALAWLAWYAARPLGNKSIALVAGSIAAFSPVFIFNVAAWKQVDSVITLALVLCFLLLDSKKWYAAAGVYALAVLIKPQAFILGPVLAIGYLLPLATAPSGRERLRVLLTTAGSAVCCLAIIFVGALPFQGTQSSFWLLEKYFATMSYYSYGSVNAFNLFGALGGNWQPADSGWLFTYSQWGIFFVLCSTAVTIWIAVAAARKGRTNLTLLAALYGILVFTFAHGMHERYSLPFLALLLFGWIRCRDRQLLGCFAAQSIASLFNVAAALWCLTDSAANGSPLWQLCLRLGGVVQVGICIWLLLCCVRILCGSGPVEWAPPTSSFAPTRPIVRGEAKWAATLPWNRRDIIYITVPTVVCAIVSFWGLGSMEVPATTWDSSISNSVELGFDQPTQLRQLWIYGSIGDGFVELWESNADDQPIVTVETPFGNMYRWQVIDLAPFSANRLILQGYDASINELVFVDAEGNTVPPDYLSPNGAALFDEQHLRPDRPSSYTGMYFDEIYHARTAYEHLNGMEPYENSHPPLGKILIMLGIKLFGMNPFGWRVVGTLFGVLLLPLIYLVGRLLLGNREYALLGLMFLSLDFMRYTQSRIGTIDTFAVFFILASYYFMLQWLRMVITVVPIKRQLISLGLSGLCFGLACSVKWVGIYSGIGLAVLFFTHLWEAREQRKLVYALIGSGFGFFVALPATVYLLSYMPYYLCTANPHDLGDVWGLQEFMLGYHGKLTDTHPFESRWYSWPFVYRPIWYSMGTHLPQGMVSSIALLGNPALWWSGAAAMVCLGISWLRSKRVPAVSFLLIAFLSQFVPWIFIARSTFLYHYFPSLPFVILALCLVLQQLAKRNKHLRIVPFFLIALGLGLFIWFYPAMCDLPVTGEYAQSLLWFEAWGFYIV